MTNNEQKGQDGNDVFEADLKEMLGDKIRESEEFATAMWSALANVDWYHTGKRLSAGYSFRVAGGLIAGIRGETGEYNYMKWYCSGPYAEVSEVIARSLKKKGWIYDTSSEICDEPNCLSDVSMGIPTKDGYRNTCYEPGKNVESVRGSWAVGVIHPDKVTPDDDRSEAPE